MSQRPRASEAVDSTAPVVDGRSRAVVERVTPCVDGGRFPAKCVVGELFVVEADVFADGHDKVVARLRWRADAESGWREVPMQPLGNDRWRAAFTPPQLGRHHYTVLGWVDPFRTWQDGMAKKIAAGADRDLDYRIGAALIEETAAGTTLADRQWLQQALQALTGAARRESALDPQLLAIMDRAATPPFAVSFRRELTVVVEPPLARCSAWYELFPRSCTDDPDRHGTFGDVERLLPEIAGMGFDVLYLPPIHPIGRTARKGPNNTPNGGPDVPGSPWAIGAAEGGHLAIHPKLGDLDSFRSLVDTARRHGISIALDIAFQASPDHPWLREHPEWFRRQPDGSIAHAENPPKQYQDIHPFDFECEAWRELWQALRGVFAFWIEHGVEVFRVDNPHTKSLRFWEWCIEDVKRSHPQVIFLSEAFTRPKLMYRLAKAGFSQSYTYFPWRNAKYELVEYFRELTNPPVADFFRGNHWPNTPDILPAFLQHGGRAAFECRLVLAATLAANYGIYGPAFERCEHQAVREGSEEYLDSEKYQIRARGREDRREDLRPLITRLNRIRRENPALQLDRTLRFHATDNEHLLCYSKSSEDCTNVVLVVVNLDPHHRHAGWLQLDCKALGVEPDSGFQVHDLISGARYLWRGPRNWVELDPQALPAHVLRVRRHLRTEQDFEYFL